LLPEDYDWAIRKSLELKLSHNAGAWDCLIGAVAHRLQVPLYTPNLKHFQPLLGELAQKPY
jgi:predicted nucleic acid-binding protein